MANPSRPTPTDAATDLANGVVEVDPLRMTPPPADAKAVELYVDGRIIGGGWVIPEHADSAFNDVTWGWFDRHQERPKPHVRLLP